jgi:hypothetical protein
MKATVIVQTLRPIAACWAQIELPTLSNKTAFKVHNASPLILPFSQCNVIQNYDSWYTELFFKKQQQAQERDQEIILHLVYIMMFNKNVCYHNTV